MGGLFSQNAAPALGPAAEAEPLVDPNVHLSPKMLEAYETYVLNLSNLRLYTSKFSLNVTTTKGLTTDEFKSLMDHFHVPVAKRFGSSSQSVTVMYEESGRIRKCILIFVRKNKQYTVLISEASQESGIDYKRTGIAASSSLAVAGLISLLNPAAGLIVGVSLSCMVGGKVIYDRAHHDFKDVLIGFMMNELIQAGHLRVAGSNIFFVTGDEEVPLDPQNRAHIEEETE